MSMIDLNRKYRIYEDYGDFGLDRLEPEQEDELLRLAKLGAAALEAIKGDIPDDDGELVTVHYNAERFDDNSCLECSWYTFCKLRKEVEAQS